MSSVASKLDVRLKQTAASCLLTYMGWDHIMVLKSVCCELGVRAFGDISDFLTAVSNTCTDRLIITLPHPFTLHSMGRRKVSTIRGGGARINGTLKESSQNKVKLTSGYQGHCNTLLYKVCHAPFLNKIEGKKNLPQAPLHCLLKASVQCHTCWYILPFDHITFTR